MSRRILGDGSGKNGGKQRKRGRVFGREARRRQVYWAAEADFSRFCRDNRSRGGGGSLWAQSGEAAGAKTVVSQNQQKVYPIDSEVYQAIKSLYIARGLALPSTTGPWSGAELRLMLSRIDQNGLSDVENAAFEWAEAELAKEHGVFKFNFTPTLELHAHTNTEDFVTPDQYIRPINEMKPMLAFSTEAWFADRVYALGALDVGNKIINGMVTAKNGARYAGSTLFGESAFSTNIWAVPPSNGPDDLDWVTPKRALLSGGGSFWNLTVGRDRLSWGPGQSGNFMVGSHVDYHDSARFTLFNDSVKYTFNVSSFQYPGEYFWAAGDEESSAWHPDENEVTDVDGVNLFIAHRFEFRALKNKLNFVISEAAMAQSGDGTLNPQVFFPMTLMHNLYRWSEMNSLLTLEADYTVMPALNIYAQFAMDEFAIPVVDDQASETSAERPNAFGYMLGAQTAMPLFGRLFTASLEAAYTDPFLYLRGATSGSQSAGEAGINFVVANRETLPVTYYEEFLGYRWGGDAIVANAHAGLREVGVWNAEANLMFMVHGTYDKWTTYNSDAYTKNDLGNYPQNSTPTTTNEGVSNHADPNASERNAPYYLTAFSLLGSWNLPWVRGLSLYGQADLVNVVNPGNIKGADPATDLQLTVGASYSF